MDRELLPAALRDLVEGELHLDAGVATRRRPPATADRGATPEELLEQGAAESARSPEDRFEEIPAENVFDVRGVREAGPVEPLAAPDPLLQALRAELVVDPALLVVRQDLVGLGDLLELLFRGFRILPVQVGMVFLRHLAVGALDFVLRRPSRDAEDLIVVGVGHSARFRS